jgi:catechol 2,3-dioxygenase-like lactoylglutathione lyase family enzyme
MNITHLHLHVKDRSASERFYENWLGLRVGRRGKALTFLTDDAGFDLALMDDSSPGDMPRWFHFGTKLESADAVSSLHERMAAASVTILKPLYRDEMLTSFRCTDPDGYAIEIYWEAGNRALD